METWKMDDFPKKLKKVVRIVLYGPAISQSDCRKPGPYQLPCNNTLYKLCAFPVRICIPSEAVNSRWVNPAFSVRHTPIPGEDESQRDKYPYREWWFTWNEGASLGMRRWLNGNAHHHQECIPSPRMHIAQHDLSGGGGYIQVCNCICMGLQNTTKHQLVAEILSSAGDIFNYQSYIYYIATNHIPCHLKYLGSPKIPSMSACLRSIHKILIKGIITEFLWMPYLDSKCFYANCSSLMILISRLWCYKFLNNVWSNCTHKISRCSQI